MSNSSTSPDALDLLRASILANIAIIPTTSSTPTSAPSQLNLAEATYLQFNHASGPITLALDLPTRFESANKSVDLRSIYFAWLNKDLAITDYIASISRLNDDLATANSQARVQNLVFAEKLDLITWLEGASEDSEYIKPLAPSASSQPSSHLPSSTADPSSIAHLPSTTTPTTTSTRAATTAPAQPSTTTKDQTSTSHSDPRLREILNGERRLNNRNTALRGLKSTDFTSVRKHAEHFLGRAPGQRVAKTGFSNGGPRSATTSTTTPTLPSSGAKSPAPTTTTSLVQNRTKPGRRPEPIILLSPSASSLLRMSNIKSFLDSGLYTPPDSSSSAASANLLHIARLLPSIDPNRALRFVLVDTPELFKPDYWDRVVAVFTTGQTWQFKGYRWSAPAELFSHALGVYVGWRGEDVPPSVKGWGRGVVSVAIDKPVGRGKEPAGRWRDREVVEGLWSRIEEGMRARGWGREGGVGGR